MIHGGSWRAKWGKAITRPVCADLARRGWAAWNIEYRRLGRGQGGGWPATFDDVAAAIDHLAAVDGPLDLERVVGVGHSAGGHLALWAAGRESLPAGAPGADPAVRLSAVVALAPVASIERRTALTVPGGAVHALLGGTPDEHPDRYALANPIRRLPIGVPALLVHESSDETVPVGHSREYAQEAQAAGDPVELVELAGASHRSHIDPRSVAWATAAAWLEARRASPAPRPARAG